jgi:hypothetical protein
MRIKTLRSLIIVCVTNHCVVIDNSLERVCSTIEQLKKNHSQSIKILVQSELRRRLAGTLRFWRDIIRRQEFRGITLGASFY